jgi:hypothetical protein
MAVGALVFALLFSQACSQLSSQQLRNFNLSNHTARVGSSTDHPHPPCCGAHGTHPPAGQPSCPTGPCTACRTPGANVCCPCLPEFPPLPNCTAPDTCLELSSARGYGVGLGMLDALVYAGGFKVCPPRCSLLLCNAAKGHLYKHLTCTERNCTANTGERGP